MKNQFIVKMALVLFAITCVQYVRAEDSKKRKVAQVSELPESCLSAAKKMAVASANSNAEIADQDIKVISVKVLSTGAIPPAVDVGPTGFEAKLLAQGDSTSGSSKIKVKAHLQRGGCDVTYFQKN